MIRLLLTKEFAAHFRVGGAVILAVLATYTLLVQFMIQSEAPSLLQAATGFCQGAGPIVAAFTARRLFVLEHEQGTVDFLRTLPVPGFVLVATKFVLGLVLNLALNLVLLWSTAYWRQDAEIFSFDWLIRLSAQMSAYIFAWFGIACLAAHLGRYRYGAWLILFLLPVGLDGWMPELQQDLFWTAPLSDNLESTRYATPWAAVATGLGWGLAATIATFTLARYRGGSVVDAWFGPLSARRYAQVMVGVFCSLIFVEISSRAPLNEAGRVDSEPETHFHVEAPALTEVATRAAAALARLEMRYGLSALPKVSLRIRHDRRPETVLTEEAGEGRLSIGVRAGLNVRDAAREVVVDVLMGQSGGLFELIPSAGIWAVGLAARGFDDPGLERTASRLSTRNPTLLEDYDTVFVQLGRRGAQAVGWLAWEAVEELGGMDAARGLAQALFGTRRKMTGGGLIAARTVDIRAFLEEQGVSWASLVDRWTEKAKRREPWDENQDELPKVELQSRSDAAPVLRFGAVNDTFHGRVELWWSRARPLSVPAVPVGPRYSVVPNASPPFALLDPRERIVATWVIDGEVLGWVEVPRWVEDSRW